MSQTQSFVKTVPFEDHNTQLENSIIEYDQIISNSEEYSDILEEACRKGLDGSEMSIHGDLEYLTAVRFLEKEVTESGEELYSLTDTANEYLERFRNDPEIQTGNDFKKTRIELEDQSYRLERNGGVVEIYQNGEGMPAGKIHTMSGEIAAHFMEEPDIDRLQKAIE